MTSPGLRSQRAPLSTLVWGQVWGLCAAGLTEFKRIKKVSVLHQNGWNGDQAASVHGLIHAGSDGRKVSVLERCGDMAAGAGC